MSVLFKEVDVLDLRCYSAGTLAEYVKNEQPDIVVQMIYPGSFFTDAQFQYGVEKRKQRLALDQPRDFETVWAADELEINVLNDENDKDPIIIEHAGNRREERPGNSICGLRSGKTYRFSFDEAVYTAGKSDYLIAAVHDDKENKDLQIRMIDIEYYNENGGYSWTFTIPEESGDELSFVIQFGESFRQEAEDADGTNMETKAKSREKNEYKRVITLKNPAVSATTR